MGRTGISPRPVPVAPRTPRALAVVLACLALLLCGAVEVLPRSASAAGPSSAAAAGSPAGAAGRSGALEASSSSPGVRAAGLAGVPAPTAPGGGLPPTAGPLVAPHLVVDPQLRPPTSPPATSPTGSLSSRAPPRPAGT